MTACQQQAKQTEETQQEESAALNADLPDAMYDSLKLAMGAYYQLTSALVKADTQAADAAAVAMKAHLDSLPLAKLGDASRRNILQGAAGDISAELHGLLLDKKGLDGRRESFKNVSDQLYDLLNNTGLKGTTVYRQHCPMAFNDRGAYWLSDKTEILNPYFGDQMLHCGSTTDTLQTK